MNVLPGSQNQGGAPNQMEAAKSSGSVMNTPQPLKSENKSGTGAEYGKDRHLLITPGTVSRRLAVFEPLKPKRLHSSTPTTVTINEPGPSAMKMKKLREETPAPSPPPKPPRRPVANAEEQVQKTEDLGNCESPGSRCAMEKVAESANATPKTPADPPLVDANDNTMTVTMTIDSALDALDHAVQNEDLTLDITTALESQFVAQASSTPASAAIQTQTSRSSGSGTDGEKRIEYLETDIDAVLDLGTDDHVGGPADGRLEESEQSESKRRTSSSSSGTQQFAEQEAMTADHTEEQKQRLHHANQEIHALEAQLTVQTRAIGQASKALNLSRTSKEFSQSNERVEYEKVLLLATHRRSALLAQIKSLRAETKPKIKPETTPKNNSTATISTKGGIHIQVSPRSNGSQHSHNKPRISHYILLARSGQHVEASEVVQLNHNDPDNNGLLEFGDFFSLPGRKKDFRLDLELFVMETGRIGRRESLAAHDAKSGFLGAMGKKMGTLTRRQSQRVLQRQHHSPAGPQAVLSSSFKLQGSLSLNINDLRLQKKHFQMMATGTTCDGNATTSRANRGEFDVFAVEMKLKIVIAYNVGHSGYLTLFQDVNGLGCWNRRWAMLCDGELRFWKYENDAEDESKPPLVTIPLSSITSPKIGPPPLSLCVRANTLLMESVRERRPTDRNTLTTDLEENGNMKCTRVKWLLAADSKEERVEWLECLNAVLEEVRTWK